MGNGSLYKAKWKQVLKPGRRGKGAEWQDKHIGSKVGSLEGKQDEMIYINSEALKDAPNLV